MQTKAMGLRFSQDGTTVYITALPSKILHSVAVVDRYNPVLADTDERQGYQRELVQAHVRKIARYLLRQHRLIMPTSVVLSARSEVGFEPLREDDEGISFGQIVLEPPLYLIDGMHRDSGFAEAATRDDRLENFPLPVVILDRIPRTLEIEQFWTINSTPKKVRTDLADRLLKILGAYEEPTVAWRGLALNVVDVLNKDPNSAWYRRIKLPNARTGVVSQRSFTESLKPVLDDNAMLRLADEAGVEQVAKLIDNFWAAVASFMEASFDEPGESVVQKSIGVYVLHRVAKQVIDACSRAGGDYSSDRMRKILDPAADSYLTDQFWAVTKRGGTAPNYSSAAAHVALATEIIGEMQDAQLVIQNI